MIFYCRLSNTDSAPLQPRALEQEYVDLDEYLPPASRADALAYRALVEKQLHPALVFFQWTDGKLFEEHTRGMFAEHCPFPLNLVLPSLERYVAALMPRVIA